MFEKELSISSQHSALKSYFNLEHYRQLFANETYYYWNQLWQIINYTKAYRQGIEIALLLMDKFEKSHERFDKKSQERQLILIYTQFLKMLDKADLWEAYLTNWEIIKKKSSELNLGHEYSESSRENHFSSVAKEYFLIDTSNGFKLSFLYGQRKRKELIERKLKKAQEGGKIGNYLHEQQDELTDEEIKERYEWMIKFFKTGEYDFSPPASTQKKKRRKKRNNEVGN